MFSHAVSCCVCAFIFTVFIFPSPAHAIFGIFDWDQCASAVNATYSINPNSVLLLDQNGQPTTNFPTAWGITYEACLVYCVGNQSFIDWNSFSTQLSSWLLPWVALTAQLPFETKSTFSNFQALFLAVGSPLLIIYSLALTMLNARSINDEIRQLKEDMRDLERPKQTNAVKAARVVMIESQNVPIQAVNGPLRELAQLVVDPKNWPWWPAAAEGIMRTKRGWTYSLIAQLGLVVVSQLFSIVDYFTSKADEDTISVGLGINSVWVWMIPVTLGFVLVGTQTSARSVKAALESITVPRLSEERNVTGRCVGVTDRTRYGTSTRSRLARPRSLATVDRYMAAHPHQQQQERGGVDSQPEDVDVTSKGGTDLDTLLHVQWNNFSSNPSTSDDRSNTVVANQDNNTRADNEKNKKSIIQFTAGEVDQDQDPEAQIIPTRQSFFSFDITGDDEEPGPIFNYARVWSHMNFVSHIVHAFRPSIDRQKHECTVRGPDIQTWIRNDEDANLSGTQVQMSRYISPDYRDIDELSVHSNPLPVVRRNCIIAALVAFFLFWGTTGAGFLIAYETPTVGIGCDSGSYLLYGITATLIWTLLTLSAYLSHLHSVSLERSHAPLHPIIAPLAVLTRISGKALAFFNACGIIVTSMLQFTNLYNNCWCGGTVLGLGVEKAWVIPFATPAQIASASTAFWIAGVFLSLVVAIISGFFFWVSKGSEIFSENTQ